MQAFKALAFGSLSMLGAASVEPVAQGVLDANEQRFAAAEIGATKLGGILPVCGVQLPFYLKSDISQEGQSGKITGEGRYGVVANALLTEAARKNLAPFGTKEQMLLEFGFVVKQKRDQADPVPSSARSTAASTDGGAGPDSFLRENLVGSLLSEAALPESSVIGVAGGLKTSPQDTQLSGILMEHGGLNSLDRILSFASSASGKKFKGAAYWDEFTKKVSFLDDPLAASTEAAVVAIQQTLLALEHTAELKVAHNDVKPSSIMLGNWGTSDSKHVSKLIDFGLGDVSLDYFCEEEIEKQHDGDMSRPKNLPKSWADYQPMCRPNQQSDLNMVGILMQQRCSREGTPAYSSPLRYLACEKDWFWKPDLADQILGPDNVVKLANEAQKYGDLPGYGTPTVDALHHANDLFGVGMTAIDLLVGDLDALSNLIHPVCEAPQDIFKMKLDEQYTGFSKYCWILDGDAAAARRMGFWSRPAISLALAKWLDGDKVVLYEHKQGNNNIKAATTQSHTLLSNKKPLAAWEDDPLVVAEKKLEDIEGGAGAGGGKVEEDEASVLAAAGVKKVEINEDAMRRRTFALLYALARHAPTAQMAVQKGLRKEFSKPDYPALIPDESRADLQRRSSLQHQGPDGYAPMPRRNSALRFAQEEDGNSNRTALATMPGTSSSDSLGAPRPRATGPFIIDAAKSSCPKSLLADIAEQGTAGRSTIPFRSLSQACLDEIVPAVAARKGKVKVINLPANLVATSTGNDAPVPSSLLPGSPAQAIVKSSASSSSVVIVDEDAPVKKPMQSSTALKTSLSPPSAAASGVFTSAEKTKGWNLPQLKPVPRFLRTGASNDVDAMDPPSLVLYSKNHEMAVLPDSPVGWLWKAPPRIDGRFDVVLPPSLQIYKSATDKASKDDYDITDFPKKRGLSDAFPRFPFIDLQVVTSLHGKYHFEVTEEELRKSAEESPAALAINFEAKPATAGIVDLVRGLLALHTERQLTFAKAIELTDDIRLGLIKELGVDGPQKENLENHINCVRTCKGLVQAYRASEDPKNDALAVGHCYLLHQDGKSDLWPYCEGINVELTEKYQGYGREKFYDLVRPSRGITMAAWENVCRENICAKGSRRLVPSKYTPWKPTLFANWEYNEYLKEKARLKEERRRLEAAAEQAEREAKEAKQRAFNEKIKEKLAKRKQALEEQKAAAEEALKKAEQEEDEAKKKRGSVGLLNVGPNQQQPSLLQDQQQPSLLQDQQQPSLLQPNSPAITNAFFHKLHIRSLYQNFLQNANDRDALPPNEKKKAPALVEPVIREEAARKSPVRAGNWFGSASFSYSKNRLLRVIVEQDTSEKHQVRIRPAIAWFRSTDKAKRKQMKGRNSRAVKADFGAGEEKGRLPIWLPASNDATLVADDCSELARKRSANRALNLPNTFDSCGSYLNDFPGGSCKCFVLGDSGDHTAPYKMLRVFFHTHQEAEDFQADVRGAVTAALEFVGDAVRKPGQSKAAKRK